MKISAFLFFLFFFSTVVCAQQKGVIVDQNQQGVPYANIYLKSAFLVVVADSVGRFSLPESFLTDHLTDTLVFSSIGYKQQEFPAAHFAQSKSDKINLVLETVFVNLPEVTIVNLESKGVFKSGLYEKSSTIYFNSCVGSCLCVKIENNTQVEGYIRTIYFDVKSEGKSEIRHLKLAFLSKTDTGFSPFRLEGLEPIVISDFSKKQVEVNVSKYSIPFTKEGIYLGIEWIGSQNEIQDLKTKTKIGISCTSKVKKRMTWIKELQTQQWIQFPPFSEEEIQAIPKLFRNSIVNINPRIGVSFY